jgi:hypothetical protein
MISELIPNYSITANVSKSVVDPGDQVKIEFYFYGNGPVNEHKFEVHIPPELVDGDVQIKAFKFIVFPDGKPSQPYCPPDIILMNNHFVMQFAPQYFTSNSDVQAPTLYSEGYITCNGVQYAPVSMYFTISNKASPGEHQLFSKLIYVSQSDVRIADAVAIVRVRSFGERNQNFLMGGLSILAVLVPLLIASASRKYRIWIYAIGVLIAAVLLVLLRQ